MGIARSTALLLASLCVWGAWPGAAQAQSWDNSGNSLLSGIYYFRQVIYIPGDADGDLQGAIAIYGNITFTPATGSYSITGATVADSSDESEYGLIPLACYLGMGTSSTCSTLPVTGSYSFAASGYGFFTSPVASISTAGDKVYGLVSTNGILIGSSTETYDNYNDLFIAAPIGPATPNFSGSYTMYGYIPAGTAGDTTDVAFNLSPGQGTVTVTGYVGQSSTNGQASPGMKYSSSNGAEIVTFPNSTTAPFYAGPEYLYFTPDGSFCFGGSPTGWDMLIGVRGDSSTFKSGVIYDVAGLDMDTSTLSSAGYATSDSFYGTFSSTNGSIIETDRVLTGYAAYDGSGNSSSASGDTYTDTTSDTTFAQYAFTDGGTVRIGEGIGPYLGLSVALQAPTTPGSAGQSVYIDPTSLQNSASYAPFTAGIAPGELISIYGSNLASTFTVTSSSTLPTTLGGVQVMINGVAAPIYYVGPGVVCVMVPYETTSSIATIQVINSAGGTVTGSNFVYSFVNKTSDGLFTYLPSGSSNQYAVALHNTTYQLVSPSNPAQPGEFLAVYVTGLGAVYPAVQDGVSGPVPASSSAYCLNIPGETCQITASMGTTGSVYTTAPVVFAGLWPTELAGLYQVNLQVPSGLTAGDNYLQICGPDYCDQTLVSVGGSSALDKKGEPTHSATMPRSVPRRNATPSNAGRPSLHPAIKPSTGAASGLRP